MEDLFFFIGEFFKTRPNDRGKHYLSLLLCFNHIYLVILIVFVIEMNLFFEKKNQKEKNNKTI